MIALIQFVLAMLAAPFRSKSQLEAENAALRQQLVVLQRKVKGRVALSNCEFRRKPARDSDIHSGHRSDLMPATIPR